MKRSLIVFFLFYPLVQITVPVTDFSRVYHGSVNAIQYPETLEQLSQIVIHAHQPISVVGGNYSMGGQTWYQDGIVINMKHLNAITDFNLPEKMITVQTGACWSQIQEFLHDYNLTVKVMQSYKDFSVGGSLSVNVHGRDLTGQIIETVESITVMIADGSLVIANRQENQDLFAAVIGGYGACGIIVSVTLRLDDNYPIKRTMKTVEITDFVQFYQKNIADDDQIALFNANIYGPKLDKIINFIWYKTDESLTKVDLAIPDKISKMPKLSASLPAAVEYALGEFVSAKHLRFLLDDKIVKNLTHVVWRSYEMSHSVKSLTENNDKHAHILQEYFVPVDQFDTFVAAMRQIFIDYKVKVINISIRYVPANNESFLTYASQDCFAFVCYLAIDTTAKKIAAIEGWTQKLIDAVIASHGTYYLPYHLFASKDQFMHCYPGFSQLLTVKQQYDPSDKFKNNLVGVCQSYYQS